MPFGDFCLTGPEHMPTRKEGADRKAAGRRHVALGEATAAVGGDLTERWFEVARCGTYYDWRYGTFAVTPDLLAELCANFGAGVLGTKVALDLNHEPDHKAYAWVTALKCEGESLMARFGEWTPDGEKAIAGGEFRYFSIDFDQVERPSAGGGVAVVPNVLYGIAMTNRPVLKGMDGTFSSRERVDEITIKRPAADAEADNAKAMKNIVAKYAESLLKSEQVSAADKERFGMMLAELPEADRKEFADTASKIEAKASETAKVQLAAKDKDADAGKQLAATNAKLAEIEASNKVLLAEKSERETKECVESMMLSETNRKGFPAAKRTEAEALVKEMGVAAARKFAAALKDHVTVLAEGQTQEIGSGAGKADEATQFAADRKAAEEMAKTTGKPTHVCLAAIISERESKNGGAK